ncbi:ribose-phosphate pyrophosphokinase [Candidatus Woesearchaeota archaeon]|nr:ribose-phosphate pyrophosphokinase [Candidatus Woesearchaeota archaeon]
MSSQPKMLLVACSGDETAELAGNLQRTLQDDYGLEHQVELLLSKSPEEAKGGEKNHRSPLVAGYFADLEAQIDAGRNLLKDIFQGRHVVLVEHMLTPARRVYMDDPQITTVNDHLMTIRGFLDLIRNVETLQATLVTPYEAYVRSHSVEKYRKRGFFQFDSLRLMLDDLRRGGLNAVVTIDPHSEKAAQISEELGIDVYIANPFQSGRGINPFKLGLEDGRAEEIMRKLRPFQERFAELKEQYKGHMYVVSVDDGTEHRCENFVERAFAELRPHEYYARIAYFEKDRVAYGDSKTAFKPFSKITQENIDREGVYIIIDDMFASGGTSNKAAKILKNCGAKRVEVWTSHAVTMPKQYKNANNLTAIDKIVCLDTVPQSPELNVEYMKASADLLAAKLYQVHQRLVSTR